MSINSRKICVGVLGIFFVFSNSACMHSKKEAENQESEKKVIQLRKIDILEIPRFGFTSEKVILVSGASSAGKSYTVRSMKKELSGRGVVVSSLWKQSLKAKWIFVDFDDVIKRLFVPFLQELRRRLYPDEPEVIRCDSQENIELVRCYPDQFQSCGDFCKKHSKKTQPVYEAIRKWLIKEIVYLWKQGKTVIVERGFTRLDDLTVWLQGLKEVDALFVKVGCPFVVAVEREKKRKDRRPGLAKRSWDVTDCCEGVSIDYDIVVDTEKCLCGMCDSEKKSLCPYYATEVVNTLKSVKCGESVVGNYRKIVKSFSKDDLDELCCCV